MVVTNGKCYLLQSHVWKLTEFIRNTKENIQRSSKRDLSSITKKNQNNTKKKKKLFLLEIPLPRLNVTSSILSFPLIQTGKKDLVEIKTSHVWPRAKVNQQVGGEISKCISYKFSKQWSEFFIRHRNCRFYSTAIWYSVFLLAL